MQLRIGERPAFLGDALGAKRRVCAQEVLVLLARAHILFGALIGGCLRRRGCGRGDQPGGDTQPTIVKPPLTLNTWPVM